MRVYMHSGEQYPIHNSLPVLDPDRYQLVDMLYNIGRKEGAPPRGLDVIDKTTQLRRYITSKSPIKSEGRIRRHMGQKSILTLVDNIDDYSVYNVPLGARLLVRTLEIAPYSTPYMDNLINLANDFLRQLGKLDPSRFGIQLEHLAIAHNGLDQSPDDIYMTIVPPFN